MCYTENKKYYIVFPNTRLFLKALPFVEKSYIEHRVVSMPDYISDQCGMTIEIYGQYLSKAIEVISAENIKYEIKE